MSGRSGSAKLLSALARIRERLTYANVMSTIAVFLVLGGASAFAAAQLGKNSVGPKQLKRGAVTAKKLKRGAVTARKLRRGAVTGAKVRDGSLSAADLDVNTLPPVPAAVGAGNANAVGGQAVHKLFKTIGEGEADVAVATVAGFAVSASCNANDADVTVAGPSGVGFVIQSGGMWPEELGANTGSYASGPGGERTSVRLDEFAGKSLEDADFGVSTITAATSAGTTLSGTIAYDYDSLGQQPPNTCLVYGHLLAG